MIITTIHGDMEEALLEERVGTEETDAEVISWTEYWYNNGLVHRSVHMDLKQGLNIFGETAVFS